MTIMHLDVKPDITTNKKLNYAYSRFKTLLEELRKKELPSNIIESINQKINEINFSTNSDQKLRKLLSTKHTEILGLVQKELKLFPENHYTLLWMTVGMAVFGLPIGIIYGKIVGNMGLLALGLPFGLGIGILVGMWFDNKIKKEGRQLSIG